LSWPGRSEGAPAEGGSPAIPYSYLAQTRLGRTREETGANLVMRPMLVGAVFRATGARSPAETPAKRRYQREDLRRWAELCGVPLAHPDPFPFRTVETMRAAVWLGGRGGQEHLGTSAPFAALARTVVESTNSSSPHTSPASTHISTIRSKKLLKISRP